MQGNVDWIILHLKAFGYVLPRFIAVFTIMPLLGRETLPMVLRVAAVGSFALLEVPAIVDGVLKQHDALLIIVIIGKEILVGTMIGFVISIPLWAFEVVGDLCDTQRGASISQILNPLSGHETSPLGELYNQAVVTLMFVIGGFILLLGVIYDSYRIWPVFGWWPQFSTEASKVALELLDRLMKLAVLLSAPVVFCMFLAEAGMAIVSRFVPQLQVFYLAMPIKSAIAMLVFAIYGVVLFDYTHVLLLETLHDANRTVFSMLIGVVAP